jgi:hypothetical protein
LLIRQRRAAIQVRVVRGAPTAPYRLPLRPPAGPEGKGLAAAAGLERSRVLARKTVIDKVPGHGALVSGFCPRAASMAGWGRLRLSPNPSPPRGSVVHCAAAPAAASSPKGGRTRPADLGKKKTSGMKGRAMTSRASCTSLAPPPNLALQRAAGHIMCSAAGGSAPRSSLRHRARVLECQRAVAELGS